MNKLFIIGLPRTGTTSVSVALLDYSFKVAHTAYTKRAFELADVVSDAPAFCDFRQLDNLFPGSKFVYLERSLELWVPSMRMLLTKMRAELGEGGYLHPVLKRSMNSTFALLDTPDPTNEIHLQYCYRAHQQAVTTYFAGRDDLLTINISHSGSLQKLLNFVNINTEVVTDFPKLNTGKEVDNWKNHKHPNKINSYSAGKEHQKFFDYC